MAIAKDMFNGNRGGCSIDYFLNEAKAHIWDGEVIKGHLQEVRKHCTALEPPNQHVINLFRICTEKVIELVL